MKNTYVGKKALLKDWKSDLFVHFGQIPCSWIRIRIQKSQINADLDPNAG